jgi:exodeoxyribonuclease V alpha subunit
MNHPNPKLTPALLALMEKVRARNSSHLPEGVNASTPTPTSTSILTANNTVMCEEVTHSTNQYGIDITYNKEQGEFIHLASSGVSCVLIGAAGTGKTTCQKGAVLSLLQGSNIPVIHDTLSHKYLVQNSPGIILTSFTRRAVRNLRRAMSDDLKSNCITIHKLLEYQPVIYEVYDETSDSYKNTMRFEPTRNTLNPLPSTIRTIVFDESSMISCELFDQLCAALQHEVQFIFVGDIQQLPPVFGSAILGFKLLELPVVELTQVYRQALESPIIALATSIRNGETQPLLAERTVTEHPTQGKVTLHPWKKKLHPDVALITIAKFFTSAYDANEYDPFEDQILIPFNKSCGTDELNKHIANHIAKKKNNDVYEVIAGFNKYYFSVGDLVLFDKEDAEITRITRNGTYLGKRPQKESPTLDYWGHDSAGTAKYDADDFDLEQIDNFLANAASAVDEKVNSSSHLIDIRMIDTGEEITIDTASEVNSLILSYALTVHKSQGSEWDRVFVILHQSHNTMLQRELLYTAVTRAKKELYVICEPDAFEKGVRAQRIKGTTLAEKAEYFKGKLSSREGKG